MCLAVPLEVVRMEGLHALCRDAAGEEQRVDTLLTGPLAPGQWVLCFLGAAREVIDATRAAQVRDALVVLAALDPAKYSRGSTAVDGSTVGDATTHPAHGRDAPTVGGSPSAVRGRYGDTAVDGGTSLDALIRAGFADLVDREPQLPEFLRPRATETPMNDPHAHLRLLPTEGAPAFPGAALREAAP